MPSKTPYINQQMLQASPQGIDWTTLGNSKDKPEESAAAVMDIIWRASDEVDQIAGQTLRCVISPETILGPEKNLTVRPDGTNRVQLKRRPVIGITSAQVSPASFFPRTWMPIPSNKMDLDGAIMGLFDNSVADASAAGPQSILIAPGYITNWFGRRGYLLEVQYLNGWPHCGVGTAGTKIPAGTEDISVDDVTGWTGVTGRLYDGQFTEEISVVSVVDTNSNTGNNAQGPGTITLASGTVFDHTPGDYGIILSSLPATVIEACILLCVAEAINRAPSAVTFQTFNGTVSSPAQSVTNLKANAEKLLAPFKRWL